MLRNISLAFICLSWAIGQTQAQTNDWQKMQTVEDVCKAYPERMKKLLQAFDLNRPGLEEVQTALNKNDITTACNQLLQYYRHAETAGFLRKSLPAPTNKVVPLADSIHEGIFTFYNQTDQVPTLEDGHMDWHYNGPADDIEWAWALNRHYHLLTLLNAYLDTGNGRYSHTINRHIVDWVSASLPYPGVKSSTAMWRGLEVSFRVKRWADAFYGLIASEDFSPAARLLLLSSIPEHAHYLRNFHAQGNWLTMEMSALAIGAIAWPEFRDASSWLEYSKTAMTESLKEQVYPDGVQTELTAHYHRVALSNFDLFLKTLQQAGESLPSIYPERIEQMWNYLAYSLRPEGTNPLNNDSDLNNYQSAIIAISRDLDRPDWQYIATNGEEGKMPEAKAAFFPYAGQVVMRSGWDHNAHWSFFDIGPWGSGHQHNDKLHLSVSAFGHDYLVDSGRFAYRGEVADKFRDYARSSAAHNVLHIDGKGQAPGPREADQPLDASHFKSTGELDYAWGDFDRFEDLDGTARHTRSVTYVNGKFWIVVDHIQTDRPRQVEAFWHWHPDHTISLLSRGITGTQASNNNMYIIPIGHQKWDVELIKGQEIPQPQAWYSREYNVAVPNPTAVYKGDIPGDAYLVWVLYPSKGTLPKLKTKIIHQDGEGVKVRIRSPEGKWEVRIPRANSEEALVQYDPN
ncbi:MAG: alginate lyase family protein [Saprospiraceae bacterium]